MDLDCIPILSKFACLVGVNSILKYFDQAILFGVEQYILSLTENFRDFQDGITSSLKRSYESWEETYSMAPTKYTAAAPPLSWALECRRI